MWSFFGVAGQAEGSQRRFWGKRRAARQILTGNQHFLSLRSVALRVHPHSPSILLFSF